MERRFSLRDLAKNAPVPSNQTRQEAPAPDEPSERRQDEARVAAPALVRDTSPKPPSSPPPQRTNPQSPSPQRTPGHSGPQGLNPGGQPKGQGGQAPHAANAGQEGRRRNEQVPPRQQSPSSGQSVQAAVKEAASSSSFSIESMRKILLDMGVKPSHVNVAMERAKRTSESLAQIMRDFGFLSGEGVAQAVSKQTNFPYFPAESVDQIDRTHLAGIQLTEFKRFVPVGKDDKGHLLVAVPDSAEVNAARNVFHDQKTQVVIASEHTIQTVYRRYFANTEVAFDEATKAFEENLKTSRRKEEDDDRAIGMVRDLYFTLLRHVCYSGASDLYLYKSEYVGIVRLKINGVGQIFRTISIELYDRLLNKLVQDNTKADDLRVKPKEAVLTFTDDERLAHPDIAERFGFRLELTESRGERGAVIRILDKNAAATDLERLGFDPETFKTIDRVSNTSTGFFLVTGPTGSGKTTTLYAVLKSIDAVERSVQSIENPIEYKHGLWQQFELRKDAVDEGAEYNEWLKALLRNAPDVILVGEVRDRNVANICLSAANTGHLVFATLHTNDAVMAVARLKSLDIDLDVLGSVLLGILAQRLLRVLCKDCRVDDESTETKDALNEPYLAKVLCKPKQAGQGCENCGFTGYRGRRMIYEVLEMNRNVREALEKGSPPTVISRHGMKDERTMWATGLRLVAEGHTSLKELMRVATKNF